MSTPTSAVASPIVNVALGRSRQKIQTATVTNGAARLASSVAFATDVKRIDQCQNARSPAKAAPAASSHFHCMGTLPRSDNTISDQSNGRASATRQNALAVGPTSLSRTKIGDSAMKVAPRNSAGRAGRMAADVTYLRSFQRF